MKFFMRWLITALAAAVAVWLVPGIDITGGAQSWVELALFGLILSLLNMGIKPLLQVLSLPITVLTLGLFYLVVNTFLLYCASWITVGLFGTGVVIASFGSAFVASIVISIVSGLLNGLTGADD